MKTPANAPPKNEPKTAQKRARKAAKNERKPFVMGVFGRPHSGKTFAIEKVAKTTPATVLVYNYGRKEDWRLYYQIELKTNDSERLQFEYKGRTYDFEEDFKRLFKARKVKMLMCEDSKTQDAFFLLLARSPQLANILLVVDDATVVLGSTLTKGLKALLGKSKHNKVDVILIAHSMDVFPRSAYAFLTHIRLFDTNNPPSQQKLALVPMRDAVMQAYSKLKQAPPYTSYIFDLYTNKTIIHTPKP